MKKSLVIVALALFAGAFAIYALGPSVQKHTLQWDPSPDNPAGYYLYWRTGTNVYANSQRVSISTNSTSFDLLALNLPPAVYSLNMTSTNSAGNEGSFGAEISWDSTLPSAPLNFRIR